MRVALKIAYDGRAFYGHQRQPDARTVEGECLAALKAAKVLRHPHEAFFRSASRTDRGVSAVGNVIAFSTSFPAPDAVVGAFNDRARGVWAWATAVVPEPFHPRHAVERWYRYHLHGERSFEALREAGALFVGDHDFRSFTSDPPRGPLRVSRIDVDLRGELTTIDLRAPSFRRGMVRRIIAAMVGHSDGEVALEEIRAALQGRKRDFGMVPAEPLCLMDVSYDFPFRIVLKPKVRDEWESMRRETVLRRLLIDAWQRAAASRESL